ncbi:hypothetical protein OV203_47640 [Nannocystis sp. ILAH1]|uniref:hypothetical protein n=1 Tax=Nannocystis sp. ILAH1 TaxID=2996789 RepID=UPI00226F6922|nr:hypothetical protein [Nannocystis sp. ILAH1]MCY0994893.1 hypothetical protein [Nannocystis sp. ILAH1]
MRYSLSSFGAMRVCERVRAVTSFVALLRILGSRFEVAVVVLPGLFDVGTTAVTAVDEDAGGWSVPQSRAARTATRRSATREG